MNNVLVTGGAGFIGRSVVTLLERSGYDTMVLDPATGSGSVNSYEYVDAAVQWADHVIHLASLVGIRHYIDTPHTTVSTIIDGTRNVADACIDHDVPLIFASTSEVYGKGVSVPMSEGDDIRFGPTESTRWVYGVSKGLAEQLLLSDYRLRGLDVKIFRPFNIVGGGQSIQSGLVFPMFASSVVSGTSIKVHGDGSQTRTFCGVDDLATGILALMNCQDASGQIVNLGNDVEITMSDLASSFIKVARDSFGITASIEHVPYEDIYPSGFEDIFRRVPDLSKSRRLIGWDASLLTPLDDLIHSAISSEVRRQSA